MRSGYLNQTTRDHNYRPVPVASMTNPFRVGCSHRMAVRGARVYGPTLTNNDFFEISQRKALLSVASVGCQI